MKSYCSLLLIVVTWFNAAGQLYASSIELILPGIQVPTLDHDGLVNLTAVPAIDPHFNINQKFGTDRINGKDACVNALQAAREIALQENRGRIIAKNYSYEGARDVTIHIRGTFLYPFYSRYFTRNNKVEPDLGSIWLFNIALSFQFFPVHTERLAF